MVARKVEPLADQTVVAKVVHLAAWMAGLRADQRGDPLVAWKAEMWAG